MCVYAFYLYLKNVFFSFKIFFLLNFISFKRRFTGLGVRPIRREHAYSFEFLEIPPLT